VLHRAGNLDLSQQGAAVANNAGARTAGLDLSRVPPSTRSGDGSGGGRSVRHKVERPRIVRCHRNQASAPWSDRPVAAATAGHRPLLFPTEQKELLVVEHAAACSRPERQLLCLRRTKLAVIGSSQHMQKFPERISFKRRLFANSRRLSVVAYEALRSADRRAWAYRI
jgi:hypothetical protein